MDPGNFATNIQGGAKFGYELLWVILGSNLMAMLLQSLSAKLEIATGQNLAEHCRNQYSHRVVIGMWVIGELVAIATDLVRLLASRRDRFASMPVLGRPEAVRAGEATLILGAPSTVRERLGPVVAAISPKVLVLPEPPLAAAAKLATNSMLLTGVTALAEAFAVGRSGGLDTAQLRTLFEGSPVVAAALANRFDAVLEGAGDAWWTVELGHKDALLALDVAGSAGSTLPVLSSVRDAFDRARSAGLADEDIAAITRLYGSPGTFEDGER